MIYATTGENYSSSIKRWVLSTWHHDETSSNSLKPYMLWEHASFQSASLLTFSTCQIAERHLASGANFANNAKLILPCVSMCVNYHLWQLHALMHVHVYAHVLSLSSLFAQHTGTQQTQSMCVYVCVCMHAWGWVGGVGGEGIRGRSRSKTKMAHTYTWAQWAS